MRGPRWRRPSAAIVAVPTVALFLSVMLLLALGAGAGGCRLAGDQGAGTGQAEGGTGQAGSGTQDVPRPPLLIGIEYATPGLAIPFAPLGAPAVKCFPELISWEKMQPSKGSAIDWRPSDRFVREYQDAGFSQLVLTLKSRSRWASRDYAANYCPKDDCLDVYEAWVRQVVERYDADGQDDMPGLKLPVEFVEIGSEFSSYEPEPAADYLTMLERAHRGAHAASETVIILQAAFLATTAFRDHPSPALYPAAFAAVDRRIAVHSLADVREVLDHPEFFDAVDFHALGDALEIEDTVAWLRYEMAQRGYDKPIVIGDTAPSPLAGWGPATVTGRPLSKMAIMIPPAREADRVRLAAHFTRLIEGDPAALDWTESYVAADMVKKVVIAAEQGVLLINTAFMEGFAPGKSQFFAAAAGAGSWSEMATTQLKGLAGERVVTAYHPLFHALGQLAGLLKGYRDLARVVIDDEAGVTPGEAGTDGDVRLYRWVAGGRPVWMIWLEPRRLSLPGEPTPTAKVLLDARGISGSTVCAEPMATEAEGTGPAPAVLTAVDGLVELTVTPEPIYVYGSP